MQVALLQCNIVICHAPFRKRYSNSCWQRVAATWATCNMQHAAAAAASLLQIRVLQLADHDLLSALPITLYSYLCLFLLFSSHSSFHLFSLFQHLQLVCNWAVRLVNKKKSPAH